MKRHLTIIAVMLLGFALVLSGCGGGTAPADTDQGAGDSLVIGNGLFTITLPDEAEGTFIAETDDTGISIYDKEALEADFGGFAFSVSAYENPSDYAGGMDYKIGELTSGDGTLYDIVAQFPSDVQFDYTKYTDDMPESYARLYNGAEDILKTLESADGGTFTWGAGANGEGLYDDVIAKYILAVEEGWDASRLEEEDMSPSFYSIMLSPAGGDPLDNIGYAYYDVNFDGIDELLVGEIADGDWKGTVYDVYTMVDRKPAHVISGWERNRYYAIDGGFLCNEYSSGAGESGWAIYDIEPNTTNLMYQVGFELNYYENEDAPWFISYGGEEWIAADEDEFNEFKGRFEDYIRFDFTPLSEF